MNVACPECQSVFRVDPAKVTGANLRARCSICAGLIPVGASVRWADEFPSSTLAGRPEHAPIARTGGTDAASGHAHGGAGESAAAQQAASMLGDTPDKDATTRGRPSSGADVTPVSAPVARDEPSIAATARRPTPMTPAYSAPIDGVAGLRPPTPAFVPSPSIADHAPTGAPTPTATPTASRSATPAAVDAALRSEVAPEAPSSFRPAPPAAAPSAPAPAGTDRPPLASRPVPAAPFRTSSADSASSDGSFASAAPSTASPRPAAPPVSATTPVARRPINPFLSNDPNVKARRLARALVSDMVAYHPQKREEGARAGTLKSLFREEIKKSYEEYVEQVGRDFAESTIHFQEALNDILAGGKRIF